MKSPDQEIKIMAQTGVDPTICQFNVDRKIYPDKSYYCPNKQMATGSPLLESLFAIEGVKEIVISGNRITVSRYGTQNWKELAPKIGAAIREILRSGKTLIDLKKSPIDEQAVRQKVTELFEQEINPGLAAHGGSVQLTDVKATAIYITLGGGCQGCGAARMTLKNWIEKVVRAKIPEVTEVIDSTDHSAGTNPFY